MRERTSSAALLASCLVVACGSPRPAEPHIDDAGIPTRPGHAGIRIVDRDDFRVTESCTLAFPKEPLVDANGDGVVHILGDDITVHLPDTPLWGGDPNAPDDERAGCGIRITGKNVTLRGGLIAGFKVGLWASEADGLTLEDMRFEHNYRGRLGSTPAAEDSADWLWPHANDQREWATNYGASLLIERSSDVTVARCVVRKGQNGLILDRVEHSRFFDNDFSFLSGWGLALWRSNDNTITRNALDFNVRGYSHGVYNRGQDSAGILMFEQCSRNVIAENSATHGGDGFFGFAGKEALGESEDLPANFDHTRRGNTDNLLIGNDFSYAAAHGIEMTFSFGNRFEKNRLVENAICGIWAGYSKDTFITGNEIARNGDMAYGLERGGINIEHGERNVIARNTFTENRCGIHLWWDADEHIKKLPWSQANGHACGQTEIIGNTFEGDEIVLHLRACPNVAFAQNSVQDQGDLFHVEGPGPSSEALGLPLPSLPAFEVLGDTRPVGARAHLAGRHNILMGEWGPYDHEEPELHRVGTDPDGAHLWRVLGTDAVRIQIEGAIHLRERDDVLYVTPKVRGGATTYTLVARVPGDVTLRGSATLLTHDWSVRSFPCDFDPREDEAAFEAAAEATTPYTLTVLDLPFAGGGPSDLAVAPSAVKDAALPSNHFGTLARTRLTLPAGTWRLRTSSDDGIRVSLDGELLIDDWTWHPPKEHTATFELGEERTIELEVRHFELDGYAVLKVELEQG